jgi:hypothetical protein
MASRVSIRKDLAAPAPVGNSSGSRPPSSVPAAQPVHEAGRSGTVRVRPPSPPPTDTAARDGAESLSSMQTPKRMRHRVDPMPAVAAGSSPPPTDPALMSDGDEEQKVGPPPASSAPALTPPGSSTPSASASPAVPFENSYAPRYVGKDKLLRMGLDPRLADVLVVDLTVDSRIPSPPIVSRAQYSYSAEARHKMVSMLLGSDTGFAMVAPAIPKMIGSSAMATEAHSIRSELNEAQAAWWDELVRQATKNGEVIRELAGDSKSRARACDELWHHLAKLSPPSTASNSNSDSQQTTLWERDALTSSWSELLALPSEIMADRITTPGVAQSKSIKTGKSQQFSPGRSYRLKLHGPNAEVTYIIACAMASYALLREEDKDVTQRFQQILEGSTSSMQHNADSTDSSSSDSDNDWQTARSHREEGRRDHRAQHVRTKKLAALVKSDMSGGRYQADSCRPELQLGTRVLMRPWERRFLSCEVTNWQSIGCNDTTCLVSDPCFQRAVNAIQELPTSVARWIVHQRVGGSMVSLIVREDLREIVASLNDRLRTVLDLPTAALRITCTVVRRQRGGGIIPNSELRVSLTPEVSPPRSPLPRAPRAAALLTSPPPPGSWAARLVDGVRRAAPRKTSSSTSPLLKGGADPDGVPSPSSSSSVPQQKQSPPAQSVSSANAAAVSTQPAAWESAFAALRTNVADLAKHYEALADIPRQLAVLQTQQRTFQEQQHERARQQDEKERRLDASMSELVVMVNHLCSLMTQGLPKGHSLSLSSMSSPGMAVLPSSYPPAPVSSPVLDRTSARAPSSLAHNGHVVTQ